MSVTTQAATVCAFWCWVSHITAFRRTTRPISRGIWLTATPFSQDYHTRGNTNASVKKKERAEFLDFMVENPELTVLNAINYERKPYRDSIPDGLGVLELKSRGTEDAKEEINQLMNEVFPV